MNQNLSPVSAVAKSFPATNGPTHDRVRECVASFAQRRLWFFEQRQPGTSALHLSIEMNLSGTLNIAALERSFEEIQSRHETLRTTFAERNGELVQVISAAAAVEFGHADLRVLPEAVRGEELKRIGAECLGEPFDLVRGPLWRARLIQLDDEQYRLVVCLHHLVCDGLSQSIFLRELGTLYKARCDNAPNPLPALPWQYGDYAAWQRHVEHDAAINSSLAYWVERLRDAPAALELPADRPHPDVQRFEGGIIRARLNKDLTSRLERSGRNNGGTLFMVLLAGFSALLSRLSGQDDLVVGTPVAGRARPDLEPLIGLFINTLPLRIDLSGNPTFASLIHRVRATALGAFEHQAVPFEQIVAAVQPDRARSNTPLFQVLFNMQVWSGSSMRMNELVAEMEPPTDLASKFDLTVYAMRRTDGVELTLVYNRDLFEPGTVEAFLKNYEQALEAVSWNPSLAISDIPLGIEPPGHCESPVPSGRGHVEFPLEEIEQSIAARFEQQADRHASRCAIVSPSSTWTYAELDARASAVAAAMMSRLAAIGGMAALLCDQDAPMVAAMLGALKAGWSYVPLDPVSPVERLSLVLLDSGADLIVADQANYALAVRLAGDPSRVVVADGAGADERARSASASGPDDLAYLLYTSGSTGTPKGVMQNHRNVLHFIRAYSNNLRIEPGDCLTLMSSYCFDAAVMDIYAALLNGATLAIRDVRRQGFADFSRWVRETGVTIYHSTPTVFRQAFAAQTPCGDLAGVRLVVMGGEATTRADFERFRSLFPSTGWFVNGLGPTESTVTLQNFLPASATVARHSVPVGLPVDGTVVELRHPDGRITDLCGELVIRSRHVALGYWKQPELTARAFGEPTGPSGERTYRTGDIVRRLSDGTFAFVGRRDGQVKVRGMRVELGEIEAVLATHEAVAIAVVAAKDTADGQRSISAFVTMRPERSADARELLAWARTRLPEYMVPSTITRLEQLPLTASGKINRSALLLMPVAVEPCSQECAPPRTKVEQLLVDIWTEVLGVAKLGIHDNFFDLGGHSLLATQLISRLHDRHGIDVPLRLLFEAPTIEQLGRTIDDREGVTV